MRFALSLCFSLLFLVTMQPATADEGQIGWLFDGAIKAAERGEFANAVELMEQARAGDPEHPNILWNLGVWYGELGNHKLALERWQQFRIVAPMELEGRAKMIQTYQALGRLEERDREHTDLLAFYADADDTIRAQHETFCRDQFEVKGTRVMAFEIFEPSGDRMVFYSFFVLDSQGEHAYTISLGSYDMTTQMSRATGSIGPDERMYHLDLYTENSHGTLGFMDAKPGYDELKKSVVKYLKKRERK